jgi:hypothetical protein
LGCRQAVYFIQEQTCRRTNPQRNPANIRDADGSLHKQAAKISKWLNDSTDYAGGVRYALGFTTAYISTRSKPIDYAAAPLDLLRDYAVHGYDFTIRSAALDELLRRVAAQKEAQG